jgi:hypothetical protein
MGSPGGLTKSTEFWRYHSVLQNGATQKNVDMTFVDTCNCGDYQLQSRARN